MQSTLTRTQKQKEQLLRGLQRACQRLNCKVTQFYNDPFEIAPIKPDLPPIAAEKNRFLVPDF